ncbi:MAG TPA: hypothetical protein VLI65_00010 [Pyrinomonadaceae bacterium]|nr:hypothetical protein [Pyrinomonadaceae bacterium]
MTEFGTKAELELTVVLAVVSGGRAVKENLSALVPQIDFEHAEVIVPYDRWSLDVGDLVAQFPDVTFHFIEDLGVAASPDISAHQHRLYDRRRAIGLRHSRGRIIAMTEDHALPAGDWVQQVLAAHEQAYAVIGGAVQNAVDAPLNRAWYYCDFGRYGLPLEPGEATYVTDVNLAYKREALAAVQEVWTEAYHETAVHSALNSRGEKLFLDGRMVVFQNRPRMPVVRAIGERMEWGRVFSETRSKDLGLWRRLAFAAGTPLLPLVLLGRVFRHMRRQRQTVSSLISTLPVALLLLCSWSWGEFVGYLAGEPTSKHEAWTTSLSGGDLL